MAELPREAFDPFNPQNRNVPALMPDDMLQPVQREPVPAEETPAPHLEALDIASKRDPNKVAEVIRLGQETDIDEASIERDPEKAKRIAWLNSLQVGDMGDRSPKTTQWLSDPRNASVAKDDIPTLEEIERRLQADDEMGDSVDDLGGVVDSWLVGLAKMWETTKMFAVEVEQDNAWGMTHRKMREEAIKNNDQDMIAYLDKQDQARNDFLAKQRGLIQEAEDVQSDLTPKNMSVLLEGIRGGVTMILDMAPGLAASLATRGKFNPTLGFLTVKTFSESYGSARLEGMEFEKAMRYGMIDAAIEYGTERMPTGMIEKIFNNLGKDGLKREVKQWLIREAWTEQLATAGQSLNAALHDLDDELVGAYNEGDWGAIFEIQGRRQVVTGIATLVGGGTMSGSINALNRYMTRDQRVMRESISGLLSRRNSEEAQKGLDNLLYLAQSSKTNERAKTVFNDFIETVGADKKMYIAADVIGELDNAPQELIDQMQDNSGGYVEMPLSEFLNHFAVDTKKLDLVRRYIKTNEALKTIEELEQDTNSDYIKNILAAAANAKDTRDEAERIHETITAQLVATGRLTKAAARKSAELIPAMATAQYEEYKKLGVKKKDGSEITLEDVFEDMGLRVVGPGRTAETDIDIDETKYLNQREYDEYDQAVARGLEMTQEAREQRAEDQGYDTGLVVYRGEHGSDAVTVGTQSRRGAITYSPSPQTASFYAESENDLEAADYEGQPVVTAAYLRMDNRVPIKDDGDPFISLQEIADLIGEDLMVQIALDEESPFGLYNELFEFLDYNMDTWYELANTPAELQDDVPITPQEAYAQNPQAFLKMEVPAYRMFDNQQVIDALKALGYDSVVHPGMGINEGELEYRVFDPRQIKSIYSAFDPDYEEVTVLSQTQDLGDAVIEESARDMAGNPVTIRQSAQTLWDELQQRVNMINALRDCARA